MRTKEHLPVFGVGPFCVYSMAAMLLAGLLLRHIGLLDSGAVPELTIPGRILGTVLIVLGLAIWVKAVVLDKIGREILDNHLLTTGIYAWVRNPIYSAAAIVFTGIALLFANLWLLVLPVLFWLDITLLMRCTEEKWLLDLYGDEYRDYCRRVNRCLPWFPRRK